jgi:hypothetical protein
MDISDIRDWEIIKSDLLKLKNDRNKDLLFEDMFQISKKGYIIDSGWYESQKAFITYLIFMHNWESPIKRIVSNSLEGCIDGIFQLIKYTDALMKNNR